ncbi:hypothetical protein PG988_006274 [Apiospora saccharicola]
MAEVLGAVASSIALVEVAGKDGGAVFKLKRLWDEINNVPETIADLMIQIECLDPAIWEAETHFAQPAISPLLWNDAAARRSAQCCRTALQRLTDLVDDLSAQINTAKRGRRKIACLKVMLKKEELRSLEKRLETAVRMLQSAQNGYMITLLKLQPDIIVAKAFVQSQSSPQVIPAASIPQDGQMEVETDDMTEHAAENSTTRYPRKSHDPYRSSQGWATSFHVPRWFSSARKAWEICAERSYAGWKFNLRVYCVRSNCPTVFRAAQNGDVKTLQRLFDSGQASLYDRDPWGRTLVHYGAMGSSVTTLKLAIDMGLSIDEPDDGGYSTIFYVGSCPEDDEKPQGTHSHLMELLDRGGFLPEADLTNPTSGCNCPLTSSWQLFRLLQPISCPGHQRTSAISRLIRFSLFLYPDVRVIKSILGTNWQEELDSLCNQVGDIADAQYHLMHSMAQIIAHRSYLLCSRHNGKKTFSRLHSCASFATEVVRRTRDVHIQSVMSRGNAAFPKAYIPKGWASPLVHLIFDLQDWRWYAKRSKSETMTRSGLRQWLQIVKDAGVDLYEYGQKENDLLKSQFWSARTIFLWHGSGVLQSESNNKSTRWNSMHYRLKWYLYGFKIGSDPEEWNILWNEPTDDFAGDFWALVENRSLDIPGAWYEEEGNA